MTGERIGPYRVVSKLRESGLATFHEAVDEQSGRRAIIKVLNRDVARDPEIRHRFLKEARAVAVLQHPAILAIYDTGELPDGTPYIVTEHPQGESLYDRQRRLGQPLGLPALPLFQEIAAALAAAHDKGIVHRNLKPDSLFIVPAGEGQPGERVKIADFGLAKLPKEYQSPEDQEHPTTEGATLGTPIYMAPELFGSASKADGKADVYALAVVLYEALCGKPPFDARSPAEILGMHLFREPPPLREAAPSVPAGLAALVHAMLLKEPPQRPTMAQVAERLARPTELAAPAEPPAPRGPGALLRRLLKRLS